MPGETIGDTVTIETADHPKRVDSPEYLRSRAELMDIYAGGCVICGDAVDMSHPGGPADAVALELQDHHGGGIWVKVGDAPPVMVAVNLFPMEWSEGWGADPMVVAQLVAAQNELLSRLGQSTYPEPVTDAASVMTYVDSIYNANVKFCGPHHLGHQTQSAMDGNGHQAVGIHNIPGPIFWYQRFCDWEHWDMWGGTTGTIALAPLPDGEAQVLHVSPYHPDAALAEAWHKGYRDMRLSPKNPLAMAARRGVRKRH